LGKEDQSIIFAITCRQVFPDRFLFNKYQAWIMINFSRFLFPVVFILLLLPVNQTPITGVSAQTPRILSPAFTELGAEWADSVLNSLDTEERIGQLIMVDAYSDSRLARDEEIRRLISEYNIGGLIFMRGGPVRQAAMTNSYQELSKTPLMIAMDAEWGLGMRLDSTVSYPQHLVMGAMRDGELVYEMAANLAGQMKRMGVHINFAPVLDINADRRNPVIGSRSFGEDKWNVTEKALNYVRGLQDNGIMAVGKHFPGHGDTNQDSHHTLPVIPHDRDRFDSLELVPFGELINKGIGGIMTAHLHVPAIDSTPGLASSLSANAVLGLLRDELGFQGLVFTDGLTMRGVKDYFPPGQLEVRALLAGNDILLMPPDVDKAVSAIKEAIETGVIPAELIDERCRRVLMAKFWFGLSDYKERELSNLTEDINQTSSEVIIREITESSLTLLENRNSLLPLARPDTLKIAAISVGNGQKSTFQDALELYAPVKNFSISKYATLEQFNQLMMELDRFNLIIVGINDPDNRRSRQYGISPQTSYFVRRLSERHKNIVLTLFTSPYGLAFFDDLSDVGSILVSYEDSDISQEYSAQLIFGAVSASGRLPVNVTSRFSAGSGHDTFTLGRLKYSLPEQAGMDSRRLREIEVLVNKAIDEKATPGAQVLVARRGRIVYHRSFGYHTYRKDRPVSNNDIYDLASITKIAATVPALMKLIEEGRLDITKTLGYYLPELEGTNKFDLVIKDVLTHQAGLQPWIPFYYDTFESLLPHEELFSRRVSAHYPYMLASNMFMNRHYRFIDNLFSEYAEGDYTIRVANRMFMNRAYRDSIYMRINESALRSGNKYLYSDLGYYYLKTIIERISSEPLDSYTERNFFRPIGAARMSYLPLGKFRENEIVPTENDVIFRRQLVHGHVHDPGTAMIGGVGGHAGLFSNANDLAKLMQMFLQEGNYGGVFYFKPETISMFTSAPNQDNGNRRGIGFDKPEKKPTRNGPAALSASPESYGHTGFTGTMAWVDPRDELVYIFLSNRVHPDQFSNKLLQMNLRTKIQQIIYDSIID
jgi:beta-N-acetylhexosaminidase